MHRKTSISSREGDHTMPIQCEPMRMGVIGVGNMGYNHARVLSELKEVDLVGIADPRQEVLVEVEGLLGTRGFSRFEDLLEEGVEGVVVAVPTSLHFQIATEVIDRRIPVLIEKPLASHSREARDIVDRAQAADTPLMVGHIERFNPVVKTLKKVLEDQKIISIDITRVGPLPPRIKDVGVITDLGVHDVDLIAFLTGSEFVKVFCCSSSNYARFEDTAVMMFEMENGAVAHITSNWLTPFKVRKIEIATKEKFIEGDLLGFKVTEYRGYPAVSQEYMVRELGIGFQEPLKGELLAFVDSIREGKPVPISGRDGLKAMEIIEMCLKSSRETKTLPSQ